MSPLRVGVIGCGVMGTRHLQSAMEVEAVVLAFPAAGRAELAETERAVGIGDTETL